MRMRVIILDSAERDLKDLKSCIVKNFSLEVWRDTYAKLKESIRHLQNVPFSGGVPDEIEKFNLHQFRQVVSELNRIIYEVRQDKIYVHMIVDVRRDMTSLLTRRLLRDF
ncbi:Plasmid stabilization system protein ParE [Duganella sp. CF517]|nr:Plasmid stabilization system protein ParE [Duganella sp. CF517]